MEGLHKDHMQESKVGETCDWDSKVENQMDKPEGKRMKEDKSGFREKDWQSLRNTANIKTEQEDEASGEKLTSELKICYTPDCPYRTENSEQVKCVESINGNFLIPVYSKSQCC